MNPQKTGYSVGQRLEKLFEEVFNEIYPQIKNQKKGVLSTVIYNILDSEKSQAQEVCEHFKIDNNELDDDLSISLDIIGLFASNPNDKEHFINNIIKDWKETVKEGVKNARKTFASSLEKNEMKLFQIVVIGCLIVGTGYCLRYLQKTKKAQASGEGRRIQISDSYPPPEKAPIAVALCLVVPASVIVNIRKNNPINVSDLQELIDNSLYFLCTSGDNVNASEELLELTEEDITTVNEQREVYVRINIADGEQMIGKKVPYILKRNLPSNGQGVVRQLACLKYLSVSGLEKFNRV